MRKSAIKFKKTDSQEKKQKQRERRGKRRNKPPFLFSEKNLDEFRLINFILDKLEILCYTLLTVKKGDIKNEVYSY